jgi:hypothetical protein
MTETIQKKTPPKDEASKQVDQQVAHLEDYMLQRKAKRKAQQDEEVKLGELLKSVHNQIESMLGNEARLFSGQMLDHVEAIAKLNETIALARYKNSDLEERALSERLEMWKSRQKEYAEQDTWEERQREKGQEAARLYEENRKEEELEGRASEELLYEQHREALKREEARQKEERDKLEARKQQIIIRLKGKSPNRKEEDIRAQAEEELLYERAREASKQDDQRQKDEREKAAAEKKGIINRLKGKKS